MQWDPKVSVLFWLERQQRIVKDTPNLWTFWNVGSSYPKTPQLRACRYPSRGHISETKQDKPIVTTERYIQVGIADSFATFRSSPRRPPGGYILVSNTNMLILIRPRVRFGVRPQCCKPSTTVISCHQQSHTWCCRLLSTECDHRNLLLTVIIRCVDNICGMTPRSKIIAIHTSSSAVAERSRDAPSLSVVRFSGTIRPAQSIIGYFDFRLTAACNSGVLFSSLRRSPPCCL